MVPGAEYTTASGKKRKLADPQQRTVKEQTKIDDTKKVRKNKAKSSMARFIVTGLDEEDLGLTPEQAVKIVTKLSSRLVTDLNQKPGSKASASRRYTNKEAEK